MGWDDDQVVTEYLFDELDAGLEVHAEIDEGPLDTLALVLFLFQHEHVVVEKLLQFLIGEVDAQLLETVELRWPDGAFQRKFQTHDTRRHNNNNNNNNKQQRETRESIFGWFFFRTVFFSKFGGYVPTATWCRCIVLEQTQVCQTFFLQQKIGVHVQKSVLPRVEFRFRFGFSKFSQLPTHPPIEPCAGTTGLDRGGGCSRTTNWGLYLFDELDTGLEVHAEIDEDPIDTLALILFLFQYEHVVVEKLLQFLIGEVDAKLLETVELWRSGVSKTQSDNEVPTKKKKREKLQNQSQKPKKTSDSLESDWQRAGPLTFCRRGWNQPGRNTRGKYSM